MKSERAFRWLAYVNAALGVLTGCAGLFWFVALARVPAAPRSGAHADFDLVLIISVGLLSLGLTYGFLVAAIKHLRRPARRTALALAANTSVAIWLFANPLVKIPALFARLGPATPLVSLFIAFLVYRFVLRPAALATYAEPTENH